MCELIISNLKKNFLKKIYCLKNDKIFNIKIEKYNDTELNINKTKINNKDTIIFNFYKNFNLRYIELIMLMFKYKKNKKKFSIILPYFPYCRQNKNKLTNLELCCYILNKMKPENIITFDIHDFKSLKYINNFYNIKTYYFIKKIIKKEKIFSLIFPDKGSKKRYKILLKSKINYIVFNKKRKGNKIKIFKKNKYKIIKKKRYLIIDDIIDTGNTIMEIHKKLSKYKCNNNYVYSTHFIMKKKHIKNFCLHFKKIYTTNSFFVKKKIKKIKVFNILKLIKNDKSVFEKK
ncbi:ribose-phosphate pyrophosphokinase-like domain-containing protein [Candidatus Vidania fulgoroideorum]